MLKSMKRHSVAAVITIVAYQVLTGCDFAQALALVQALVERGEPLSKAAKDVARQTGFKKGEIYRRLMERE